MPQSVPNIWPSVPASLDLLQSFVSRIGDILESDWFAPVSNMILESQIRKDESFDTYLSRMMSVNIHADEALRASTILQRYKSVMNTPRPVTGSEGVLVPVPEPGLKALQSGKDGYTSEAKRLLVADKFSAAVDDVIAFLDRVDPNSYIASGDNILIPQQTRVTDPLDAYITVMTANDIAQVGVIVTNDSMFVPASTNTSNQRNFLVSSYENLPITPGLDYFLRVIGTWNAVGGVLPTAKTFSITVQPYGGTAATYNFTLPLYPGQNFGGQLTGPTGTSVTLIPLPMSQINPAFGLSSLGCVYSVTTSATTPAGCGFNINWNISLTSSTPIDRETGAEAIISRNALGYSQCGPSDAWYKFYGTQEIPNSIIDPDFSLAGYFNNYLADGQSLTYVMEVLEALAYEGKCMKLVPDGNTLFKPEYVGCDGFNTIVSMLSYYPAVMLRRGGLFTSTAGVPIPKNEQIAFFDRLRRVIMTVHDMYIYADSMTVTAVEKVFENKF